MNSNQLEEEPSFWRVWLTRIAVTAILIVVIEYVGGVQNQQPPTTLPPKTNKKKKEEEEVVVPTMQYTELTKTEEEKAEEEKKEDTAAAAAAAAATSTETPSNKEEEDNEKETTIASKKIEDIKDEDIYDEDGDDNNNNNNNKSSSSKKRDEMNKNEKEEKDEQSNDDDEGGEESGPSSPSQATTAAAAATTTTTTTTKFRNKSNYHPGMGGFHRWYDIETSLFRQYNVGRTDGVDVIPPYVKKSRNGQVRVSLQIVNQFTIDRTQTIKVYWINYMGHEVIKGTIRRGETWYQTTYIEHPWVFRTSDTEELILHYIPERVIPHLDEAPTIDDQDAYGTTSTGSSVVSVQRFIIKRPTPQAIRDHHICSIDDKIMPHPASHHFYNPNHAHDWTLLHMNRMDYFLYNDPDAILLRKYLTNIAMNPNNPNYRQIRIANKKFSQCIWLTPARGLLLACGFREEMAHAELGTDDQPLSNESIQDVSLVLYRLEQYLTALSNTTTGGSSSSSQQQPEGADGFGRAGFGRAGQMNVRR